MKGNVLCVTFIVFTFALTGFACAQEGVWSQIADMPTLRSAHSASSVNGKIYAIGGYGGSNGQKVLSTVEEYDPTTGTWATKAEMPTARWGHSGSVVNGKIYVIGGVEGLEYGISTVEVYDTVTDTWTTKSPMPTARYYHASCVVNGKIYVIGGGLGADRISDTPAYFGTVEEYDPETDKWITKADMPTSRGAFCCCTVNGKIYAIGGVFGPIKDLALVVTVEEYDPETDKWITKAPIPTARYGFAACAVNGKIYAIGGADTYPPTTIYRNVEEYDTVTDTWTTKSPMPTARYDLPACEVNGNIYAIGGLTDPGKRFAEVFVYTPEIGTFIEDSTPVEYTLLQNCPNPFNPVTTINYCLDKAGMVNMVIYDLLGKKVATLVDEVRTPGEYSVNWNAESHASGIYFCRLKLGGSKVLTQKMLLIR